MRLSRLKPTVRLCLLATATALALSACDPTISLRGNEPLPSRMEQIQLGKSSKRDVAGLIGSPSTISTFDDNIWYYMSQKTEAWAFYSPEVIEGKVLAFHFDDNGVLQTIDTYDETALQEVHFREKETPTSGRTMSIFEQLFGNFGKIGGKSGG